MTTITIDRDLLEQALEALKAGPDVDPIFAGETEEALRAALAQLVPHGCHVDLAHGRKPDGCVLDDGRPENCIYAKRLLREGKDKTACCYWKPIEVRK